MLQRLNAILVAAAVAASPVLLAPQAYAKAKGKAKGRSKVVFVDSDREAVRGHWVATYGRGNCPPGLAKKNNGCLPPGQTKKRYVVGRRLPRTVVFEPVPVVLLPRLRPAPAGYRYVTVDGDVLLMAVATRLVVDAIAGILD